jgi:Skp family chaperone for outer membrane proteins
MRAMLWTSGLIVALAALAGAARLSAENDENKDGETRTRIGFVNLTYVIKNYSKYKNFQDEIREIVEPYQHKDALLRQKMEKLRVEAQHIQEQASQSGKKGAAAAKKREAIEIKAKKLQRDLEDNSANAKLNLGKRSDEEMKILFVDVEEAVKRYAASHDLELVLHYNDAIILGDYLSPPNIARKLNTPALMPLTTATGLDISKDIVDSLNYAARKKS